MKEENKSLFINDRVHLLMTSLCNFDCVYCYNGYQEKNADPNYMTKKTAKAIRNCIARHNYNVGSLSFSGGEPTLHPNLKDIVKIFEGVSMPSLITNGYTLDRAQIDELIDHGLRQFQFSIDTLSRQNTKLVKTPLPQDKDKLIDCILYSNQRLGNTKLACVVLNENLCEVRKLYDFCKENGIKYLMFSQFGPGTWGDIKSTPSFDDICKQLPITKDTKTKTKHDRVMFLIGDMEITVNPPFTKRVTYSCVHDSKNGPQTLTLDKKWVPWDVNN